MDARIAEEVSRQALDRLLIAEVVARSSLHYDQGELDRFQELFSDDAEFIITPAPAFMKAPLRGREAIGRAMRVRYDVVSQTGTRRHVVTNMVFDELSPNRARARYYLTGISSNRTDSVEVLATGIYHDEFVKQDGAWLISGRRLQLDLDESPA